MRTMPTGSDCPGSQGRPDRAAHVVVNTNGSTSMEKVMQVLIEAFQEQQPNVTVNYTGSGSGAGVTSAIDGTADLGLASRALKDEEEGKGAQAHIVALDGVAIVVNPENTVEDLTVDQIAQIFKGEITNWKDLAVPMKRSPSMAVRPVPAPGAPLRSWWAWRMPAST